METTTPKHPEIQQKVAAIMQENEHARELITGFALAYDAIHAAQEDKQDKQ
jgi:hypothetical protein